MINDTDKNVGSAYADKDDVINECKRQFAEIEVYLKFSNVQVEELIRQIQNQLMNIEFHKQRGNRSKREERIFNLSIAHIRHPTLLYSMENSKAVGRLIVSGCKWILTPVSI